jgi:predicted  nucleic acid-binding Zn-ribbon protein
MIEMIDAPNMTIAEINKKIKDLNNDLDLYLTIKAKEFEKTQPKAVDITNERVDGGVTIDKNLSYVITLEELNIKIDNIQDKISYLTKYVENRLKIIGEYEPLKKKIIELRENHKMKWENIAEATNYSESQVRKIYKKYIGRRDI